MTGVLPVGRSEVLLWEMVDKSISPFQIDFGPVCGGEAVQTGLLFPT